MKQQQTKLPRPVVTAGDVAEKMKKNVINSDAKTSVLQVTPMQHKADVAIAAVDAVRQTKQQAGEAAPPVDARGTVIGAAKGDQKVVIDASKGPSALEALRRFNKENMKVARPGRRQAAVVIKDVLKKNGIQIKLEGSLKPLRTDAMGNIVTDNDLSEITADVASVNSRMISDDDHAVIARSLGLRVGEQEGRVIYSGPVEQMDIMFNILNQIGIEKSARMLNYGALQAANGRIFNVVGNSSFVLLISYDNMQDMYTMSATQFNNIFRGYAKLDITKANKVGNGAANVSALLDVTTAPVVIIGHKVDGRIVEPDIIKELDDGTIAADFNDADDEAKATRLTL